MYIIHQTLKIVLELGLLIILSSIYQASMAQKCVKITVVFTF